MSEKLDRMPDLINRQSMREIESEGNSRLRIYDNLPDRLMRMRKSLEERMDPARYSFNKFSKMMNHLERRCRVWRKNLEVNREEYKKKITEEQIRQAEQNLENMRLEINRKWADAREHGLRKMGYGK